MITKEDITNWLQSPEKLPTKDEIANALAAWPWFVPLRLIEAAHHLPTQPTPNTYALIQLYCPNIVTAHSLLSRNKPIITPLVSTVERDPNLEPIAPPTSPEIPAPTLAKEAIDIPTEDAIIQPLFTEDYFRHQGIQTDSQPIISGAVHKSPEKETSNTLMVVMSFAEWLEHFKVKSERDQQEEKAKSALKSMWQQEKLATALEEDSEEIPEDVFEMAVNSITREDDIASEPLAKILESQEKWKAAAEMYYKLGLRNPSKSSYFASRAEAAKKRLQ